MEENTYSLLNILLFLIPNIYQPLLFITEKLQDRPKTNCHCDRQTEKDCRLPILELLLEQKKLKTLPKWLSSTGKEARCILCSINALKFYLLSIFRSSESTADKNKWL